MKRTSFLVIALLVVSGLLASCAQAGTPGEKGAAPATGPQATPKAQGQVKTGGIANVAIHQDPPTFDVIIESSGVTLTPVMEAYSPLIQYDPADPKKFIPDLAEKWDVSSDGKVWTFHLRKGVKWHDGQPVTAEDARYTLEKMKTAKKNMETPMLPVVGLEATDATTLKITLKAATAAFPHSLAWSWAAIMPKHVIEAKGDMKREIVGTGPFKLKSYDPGVKIEFVKNPDYFMKGQPYLDGIAYYPMTDERARITAFKAKRVDVLAVLAANPAMAQEIQKDVPDAVVGKLGGSARLRYFYIPNDRAPWNDIRVRKALWLATDRQQANEVIELGTGAMTGVIPPELGGMPEAELLKLPGYRQPKDQDIAEAKKLLREAGIPEGYKLKTFHRKGSDYQRSAVVMQEQLAKIGIVVEIDAAADDAVFYDRLGNRKFESASHADIFPMPDVDGVLYRTYYGGVYWNDSNYSNKKVDELIDQQASTMDPVKRKEIVKQVEKLIMDDYPHPILVLGRYFTSWWKHLKGYQMPVSNYAGTYKTAWLDK